MKNLKLLLLLVLPALFVFTGCEEDEDMDLSPSLNFLGGSQYTSGDVTVEPGDTILVGITANENTNSGTRLSNFRVERLVTGQSEPTAVIDSSISTSNFDFIGEFVTSTSLTEEIFTFIITDRDGEFQSLSFVVTTEGATNPLTSAQSFTWERCGGTGTGLDQFGLSWTSNSSTEAIIKKDADKLVILTSAEWTSITTQEGLAAAVDGGTDVSEYTGVSVQSDDTYDDVLATKNGSDYFLIHVTEGTVTTGNACGTNIEITGEYKE